MEMEPDGYTLLHVPVGYYLQAALGNADFTYYDGFRREHKIRSYLKRLQALGWEPELSPTTA